MRFRDSLTAAWAVALAGGIAATAAAQVAPPKPIYVSLGSSYAAGPGVGADEYSPTSRTQYGNCARSLSNYAQLLAKARNLQLVDAACSGATTSDILTKSQDGFSPQIDSVDPKASLVTVLIGGNDVGYIGNLSNYSCLDTGGSNCKVISDEEVDARLAKLPDSLRLVLQQIHLRAPGALVVMLGYLPVLPDSGAGCAAAPLSAEDGQRMLSVYSRLTHIIGAVARETNTPVVRSSVVGYEHDACSADPYVAGFHPATTPGWAGPVAYHPNQAGMDHIAADLNAVIAGAAQGGGV